MSRLQESDHGDIAPALPLNHTNHPANAPTSPIVPTQTTTSGTHFPLSPALSGAPVQRMGCWTGRAPRFTGWVVGQDALRQGKIKSMSPESRRNHGGVLGQVPRRVVLVFRSVNLRVFIDGVVEVIGGRGGLGVELVLSGIHASFLLPIGDFGKPLQSELTAMLT